MLGTAFYVVRQATHIETTVAALQKDFAELKTDFKARDKHISESLDRIEKALTRNQEPLKPIMLPRSNLPRPIQQLVPRPTGDFPPVAPSPPHRQAPVDPSASHQVVA
jgi:hypothetical protein